ncbi:uncharacterized protein B0H64DRAFT_476721 [Chaetomium fimeti]|uniref:Uncharacterized protein n=1 Tax=Chaetomium fimeti TaxID=1854472 RepID=A0AAE0HAU7_9PEZI|nr:hypothetical protein B0H64DRAFT_476721 [Chaetomium fimeti]
MGRPAGVVGRTQLKQDDLVRIQTLSRDARMGPSEIRRVTGYSIHQIKYALKKKTPTVGKRSGRPRKAGGKTEGEAAVTAVEGGPEGVGGAHGSGEVLGDSEGDAGVEGSGETGEMQVDLEVGTGLGGEFVGQAGPGPSIEQRVLEYQEQQPQQQQPQQEQQPLAEHNEPQHHPTGTNHETGRE